MEHLGYAMSKNSKNELIKTLKGGFREEHLGTYAQT